MRDIRLQISVSRGDLERLQYLADMSGQTLSKFVYSELSAALLEYLPEGSDAAYRFDLTRRLKRVGQGHNEFDNDELMQRVKEAIHEGATGELPGSGGSTRADEGPLPVVPAEEPGTQPDRVNGSKGRKSRIRREVGNSTA